MTNTETKKLLTRLIALRAVEGDARAHGSAIPAIASLSIVAHWAGVGGVMCYRLAVATDGSLWLAGARKGREAVMLVPAAHLASYKYL